jgi:hypothetical protein
MDMNVGGAAGEASGVAPDVTQQDLARALHHQHWSIATLSEPVTRHKPPATSAQSAPLPRDLRASVRDIRFRLKTEHGQLGRFAPPVTTM